ncbi:hypothetical protein [Streptomyces sp. UNOC14_S4]|uniref:hypothetical protein n=1 Tax=Streptomyces sp. UNOC14_S4 TaxID=2872340 RepID=UPI001E61CD82|nr:hypothetical protein [Streptomyces sp. UNOC14_S4]MCC3769617.1 hypothetical protein [Streptomyces sp. UNOC14_S4]
MTGNPSANGNGSGDGGLFAELTSLKKFKGRVDDLLTDLGDSDAAPARMADDSLQAANLGTGFRAADALYGVYRNVHEDLTTLSRLLNDQIEAMGLAVLEAHGDYANTDTERRDRMWEVQKKLKQQRGGTLPTAADKNTDQHGSAPKSGM